MLSEIAIMTLTLSATVSGPQDSAGEGQAPHAPNALSAQFAGLDGPAGLLVYADDPHCREPAVRKERTEVRASDPAPRLPAISGQYQLDGGYYVREAGPNPPERARPAGVRNG